MLLGCSWPQKTHRASTGASFGPTPGLLLTSKNAPRLDGSDILKALACSWGLAYTFRFHLLGPFFGEGKAQHQTGPNSAQRLNPSALEGYLFSFRAPDRGTVRNTEVTT